MYKDDQGSGYYKELPLSEILEVHVVHGDLKRELTHYFEIKTQNSTYFIGKVLFLIDCFVSYTCTLSDFF